MNEWTLADGLDAIIRNNNSHVEASEFKDNFTVVNPIFKMISNTYYIKDQQAHMIGILIIFKQIDQQKQNLVDSIERVNSLAEMMAGATHQIRNSLTTLRGFVQYLNHQLPIAEQQEYIDIILKEVDAINLLIEQLLDFSVPIKTHNMPIYINNLIEEILVLVKVLHPNQHIDFKLLLDEKLPMLCLNKELIKQVFINLIINAIQATKERTIIEITTQLSVNQQYQLICIKDNGMGISSEIIEKIFMPFFTTKHAGTGLGLSFVKRVVSLYCGMILIKNNDNNIGTTVEVALPNIEKLTSNYD